MVVAFSIDMNALWAIVYCGRSFSIDIISLWAIVAISHREIMSIERIRCMYCFVRRTLTTKSERKFFNNNLQFFTSQLHAFLWAGAHFENEGSAFGYFIVFEPPSVELLSVQLDALHIFVFGRIMIGYDG